MRRKNYELSFFAKSFHFKCDKSVISLRWTEDEKQDNDECMESMTLIDKNGDTHCFEKDSEEEVEVQCIADDGEECQTQVSMSMIASRIF